MDPINLFGNYITKDNYTFDWNSVETKVVDLLNRPECATHPEVPNGLSTLMTVASMPHDWPELQPYITWISSRLPKIGELWNLRPCRVQLMNSWINCHPPGAKSTQHEHGNVDIVVSAYPKFPKNSGRIEFKDPLEYHWHGYPTAGDRNVFWKPVELQEGDVVFFPGWIKHRTEVNESNENRYVLTINFKLIT
jgi:hypothetical protein